MGEASAELEGGDPPAVAVLDAWICSAAASLERAESGICCAPFIERPEGGRDLSPTALRILPPGLRGGFPGELRPPPPMDCNRCSDRGGDGGIIGPPPPPLLLLATAAAAAALRLSDVTDWFTGEIRSLPLGEIPTAEEVLAFEDMEIVAKPVRSSS